MGGNTKPQQQYLHALTGLRGLAAIYIFTFHYGTYDCIDVAGHFSNNGRVAVSLFFVLSGFIMYYTHGHCEMDKDKSCRKMFWIKRWCRLMPAYLVALVLNLNDVRCIWGSDPQEVTTGNGGCSNWKWFDIFMQLFGISTWLPLNPYVWNPVGWSVQTEMGFYFLFPFFLRFHRSFISKHKWRGWLKLLVFYGLCGWGITFIIAASSPGFDPESDRLYHLPWTRCTEFAIGMLFGYMHKAVSAALVASPANAANSTSISIRQQEEGAVVVVSPVPAPAAPVSEEEDALRVPWQVMQFTRFVQKRCDVIFISTAIAVVGAGIDDTAADWCAFGVFALAFGVIIYALAANENSANDNSKLTVSFLSSKAMRGMGEISYCFYLIHFSWPSLNIWMGYHLPPMGRSTDMRDPMAHENPHLAWPYFLMSVGGAAMLHEMVEKPCYLAAANWLKAKNINCDCSRSGKKPVTTTAAADVTTTTTPDTTLAPSAEMREIYINPQVQPVRIHAAQNPAETIDIVSPADNTIVVN